MNGIGIHSMRRIARTKGNWRYWSSREKKEEKKKKRRNERGHNDIPYCDFITAQLILFGSESLRIAFRFRGVKTPAANTPNTLDPFPFPFLSAALPLRSLTSLLPGRYLSGPNYSSLPPPRGKTGKTWRRHWIVSTSSFSSRIFHRLFLLLVSSPHDCSPRVCPVLPSASQGMSPQLSDLFSFSSLSPLVPSFFLRLSRHSRSRQTSHFETNEEEEGFLGYAFSFRFEPLLSFLHSFGHVKGKR